MKLTKDFRIQEIKAARISNAPFQIVLEGNYPPKQEEDNSVLTLDTKSLIHDTTISFDLIGRVLTCVLESHEVTLEDGDFIDYANTHVITPDDLVILSLQMREDIETVFYHIPTSRYNTVVRVMRLSSFVTGRTLSPCPFYRLTIDLTREEYEACKTLSPTSLFKINFFLA